MDTHGLDNIQYLPCVVDDFPNLISSLLDQIPCRVNSFASSIDYGVGSVANSIGYGVGSVTNSIFHVVEEAGFGRAFEGCRSEVANDSSSLRASVRVAEGLDRALHCSWADGSALSGGVGRSDSHVDLALPVQSSLAVSAAGSLWTVGVRTIQGSSRNRNQEPDHGLAHFSDLA